MIKSMVKLKSCWNFPPNSLHLSSNDVHLWLAKLDQSEECVEKLSQILSKEEQRKSERFHYEKDRNNFIVTHGVLRKILSRYLGIEPNRLQFGYHSHGKPFVFGKSNSEEICFNISHSRNLSLYALVRSRQLGVDLEYIRPIPEADHIVAEIFSSYERAMWQQLPENQKQEAFFHIWTGKEAYIKARGEGLSMPLDQFDVLCTPDEPGIRCLANEASDDSSLWSLRTLQLEPNYAATLVVEGHDWQLTCWEWIF